MRNLKMRLLNYSASLMMSVALAGFFIMCGNGDYQPVVPEHMLDRE
jgi:hypothetical protein